MGYSSSKVQPDVGSNALPEWYVPNPTLSNHPLSRPESSMISTVNGPPPPYTPIANTPHFRRSNRQGDVFDSNILPPSRRNKNPYHEQFEDDEEMIRFVSMMSLADSLPRPVVHPRPQQSHPRASQLNLRAVPRRHATRTADDTYVGTSDDFYSRLRSVQEYRASAVVREEPPASRLLRTQECSICIETKPVNEFPKITSKCRHKATTCLTCLRAWISSELSALTWDKLKCVGEGCSAVLSHADMRRHATPDVFEKYDHFSMLSVLSTLPNFRWCVSPRCKSGQVHVSGTDGPIFRCVACGTKTCIVHDNVPWHEGLTCTEYDNAYSRNPTKKRREEEASKRLLGETTKKCPGRKCGAPIERISGCDHMTCAKCKYEFCWLCFADYKAILSIGNTMHKPTCRLHSNNLH